MKKLPRNIEYIEANRKKVLDWLDVDTEIELIQNKQSKLSANQRREVIGEVVIRNEAGFGD